MPRELDVIERVVLAEMKVEGAVCNLQWDPLERAAATRLVRIGLAFSEAQKCGHLACRHYRARA